MNFEAGNPKTPFLRRGFAVSSHWFFSKSRLTKVEAAGNKPASLKYVSRFAIEIYDTKIGGGGNCTQLDDDEDVEIV